MFRDVGIERDAASLRNARETVEFWRHYVFNREFDQPAGWELQNLLLTAGLTIESALTRTETRGVHFRSDYPDADDVHWRCHLAAKRGEPNLQRVREVADAVD